MEIIIGRENAKDSRLNLNVDGVKKIFGDENSVPMCVSREHCKLYVYPDEIVIENLNISNFTFVNGREYERKKIKLSDVVELGKERYRLDVETIVSVLTQPLSAKSGEVLKPSYSIAPLRDVWEEYENIKLQTQIDDKRFQAISTITGVIMPLGMVMAIIPGLEDLRFVFICISVLLAIVFFTIRFRNSKNGPLKQKELNDNFRRSYICPNPKCKRFLGSQPFDELEKMISCPYCKAKFRQ